jgi:capsular polysaccharide transport system permease protein
MITKLNAARYHTRRVERPAPKPVPVADGQLFDTHDDGFGNLDFRRPEPDPGKTEPTASAVLLRQPRTETPDPDEAELAAIAAEGLTRRQLRRAKLIADKHGIEAKSDFDAVRQLRLAGIEPFTKASLLEVVTSAKETGPNTVPEAEASPPPSASRSLARLPGDAVQLPQRTKPIAVPSVEQRASVNQAAEILRMQQEIARRRRRRLALLMARLFAFVLLPTFLAGWYFYVLATPIYSVRSEFVIQQAGPASSGGSIGGLFSGTAFATSQDSIAVQGYLQSREAMGRLEVDIGFRGHFQTAAFDTVQRLAPDSTLESAYRIYKKFVKISFDTTEGVIRMEVMAADPQVAADWSKQLISYAEEQVDHLTQRMRGDQMKDAQLGYDEAQAALMESQRKLIKLQEKFKILSSETEVGLLISQISGLESQLTQEKLGLAQMESNPEPNQARMEPIKRRIATLEAEIATLRARMTDDTAGETSLAQIQGELLIAQADLQTRQVLLAQALQSMETARIEANRQVRYLSLSVSPIPPDEPSYPRAFENTLVTMLILLGIYLMISMTAAILREQVSS